MDWLQQSLSFADTPELSAQTTQALKWVETWREPLVATVLFLECLPIVGFLAPGQIVLTIAGFWSGGHSVWVSLRMFVTCLVAIILADTLMFGIGRYCSHKFEFLRTWLGKNAVFSKALSAQPFGVLLFYQFPPYTRMFGPFLMGASQRPWRPWLGLCLTASFAFVATFFGVGLGIAIAGKAALAGASLAASASAICAIAFFVWLPFFIKRMAKSRSLADLNG